MAAPYTTHGGSNDRAMQAIYHDPNDCHRSAYGFMDQKTRDAAKPKHPSDIYKVPRPKLGYRLHDGQRLPVADCKCSISQNCVCKPPGELECRSLAPERKKGHGNAKLYDGYLLSPPSFRLHRLLIFSPTTSPRIDTKIRKSFGTLIQTVRYFGTLANDLQSQASDLSRLHVYVRKWVSDMRCFSMLLEILHASNILNILHNFSYWIIKNQINLGRVPLDIRYDLEWLKRKWKKGDLDLSDPLRGITVDQSQLGRSLDKNWPFYKDWRKFGHNGLVLGETWPHQIAILRDGGHGTPEGGISGITGKGATSIILSDPENREDYADIDAGDEIEYVSTASTDDNPTRATRLLLSSHAWRTADPKIKVEDEDDQKKEAEPDEDRPIRLFRSWRLSEKNPWRPMSGFRYDGLYDITASRLIDPAHALYRFTMRRRAEEGDIRIDMPDDQMCLLYYQVAGVQKAAKRKYRSSDDYQQWRRVRSRFY